VWKRGSRSSVAITPQSNSQTVQNFESVSCGKGRLRYYVAIGERLPGMVRRLSEVLEPTTWQVDHRPYYYF